MNEDLEGERPVGRQAPKAPEAPEPGVDNDMASKIDELKRLSDRKAQGALSEEEFEERKRRILE